MLLVEIFHIGDVHLGDVPHWRCSTWDVCTEVLHCMYSSTTYYMYIVYAEGVCIVESTTSGMSLVRHVASWRSSTLEMFHFGDVTLEMLGDMQRHHVTYYMLVLQ